MNHALDGPAGEAPGAREVEHVEATLLEREDRPAAQAFDLGECDIEDEPRTENSDGRLAAGLGAGSTHLSRHLMGQVELTEPRGGQALGFRLGAGLIISVSVYQCLRGGTRAGRSP